MSKTVDSVSKKEETQKERHLSKASEKASL